MRMYKWIVLLLVLIVLVFLALSRSMTGGDTYDITSVPPFAAIREFPFGYDARDDRILEQIEWVPSKLKSQPVMIYVPKEVAAIRWGNHELRTAGCKVQNCILSASEFHRATADVVFFSPTSSFSMDYLRPQKQLWVMQLLESPENTMNLSDFNGHINYTASYRYDSDLVTPYGKWVPTERHVNGDNLSPGKKTKEVLWLVSHCITNNARMRYANELGRHIQVGSIHMTLQGSGFEPLKRVDVFGECGERKLPKSEGQRLLAEEYKFYLAFENSNCNQYVTEKFFDNALKNGAIPIVMGASLEFYESISPPHSFIHVDQFDSPKDLAKYLRYLSTNADAFNEYFAWKQQGQFVDTKFWCRLCSLAQQPRRKVYMDIEGWWHSKNQCSKRRQGYA
uniref:Fucosyltransferase n=1 Tax=Steinernema glaseri TaxID=37863 RepID=A0A1I7XXG1_9BILA